MKIHLTTALITEEDFLREHKYCILLFGLSANVLRRRPENRDIKATNYLL